MHRPAAIVLALIAAGLAGCADTPEPAPIDERDACVVERPGDFSCLDDPSANATAASRPHLHDYWNGQDRLVVMDVTQAVGALAMNPDGGQEFMLRPEGDHVVPQGTAAVEVTISWTDNTPGHYGDAELFVVTAADREPWLVGPLENGDTLVIETTNTMNDLPHQRLSAWQFRLRVDPGDAAGAQFFQADLSILVEAIRGLEIPLYPGHPDAWQGRTEIGLFDHVAGLRAMSGEVSVGPVSGGPCILGCYDMMRPDDGAVIPQDTDFVEVTLTHDQGLPFRVGLAYHGAAAREFVRLAPDDDDGTTRVYRIPVDGDGDGPYAKQSLWEFTTFTDEPMEDSWFVGSYTIQARAVHAA